ncbi:14876_t:CDS:1 [Dentiscutata erythropus]|uniref:14876_t:CDS:1 n=1 Tax=Dentiscutata erythropus TaxID=1348616 RepID=A0A9N9NMK1_9GLOM|nr:14876_t:CDS:1 [Dentiscutata erythropus]
MEAIANQLNLDFEFFPAVSKFDRKELEKFNNSDQLLTSQKACYISHYKVYQSIIANDYDNVLILEDDVDIEMNIVNIMTDILSDLPIGWDLLYLGHCGWEKHGIPVGRSNEHGVYKSTKPGCTHAYAVSSLGANKLLKNLELNNLKAPIDLEIIEKIQQGIIISYSFQPQVIVQWRSVDNPSDVNPGSTEGSYPLRNSTLHYLGFSWNY